MKAHEHVKAAGFHSIKELANIAGYGANRLSYMCVAQPQLFRTIVIGAAVQKSMANIQSAMAAMAEVPGLKPEIEPEVEPEIEIEVEPKPKKRRDLGGITFNGVPPLRGASPWHV